jgi:hypothetical protein
MFCWCPRTRQVVDSTGTPHWTTKHLKVAAQKSNIGIFDSFPGFRRHGARGEGEGEGESMVSPCPGDMEPSFGPSFFRRYTPSAQLRTFYCKKYDLLPPIMAPWGRGGGRGGGGKRWCPHMQQAWNLYGDAFVFRVSASKQSYLEKTSKSTVSWSRGSIQPSLRVNPIQGRTEHPFRKKNNE